MKPTSMFRSIITLRAVGTFTKLLPRAAARSDQPFLTHRCSVAALAMLAGTLSLLLATNAQAASKIWNNGAADFIWNTSSLNWGGAVWTAGNDAVFTNTGVGTITVSGTQTVGTGSDTPLTFSTAGYTLSGGTLALPGLNFTNTLAVNADATITSVLSDSGTTNVVIKSGTGTLTLDPGASNTNTVGTLRTTAGGLTLNSGGLNVTAAGTAGANGLLIAGGTVTVAGGTLTANTGSYATINGGGTLAVSSGTANIAGTELLLGYASTAGTVTVSGTGTLNVPALRVSQTTGGTGTVNLNGGTLQMNNFNDTGSGGTVNFNGGTVQAKTATTAFTVVNTNITYNVSTNGAIFNNAGFNITIGSPLVHYSALGSALDGGLTKLGTGTLALTNANTYTGGTTNTLGTLEADNNAALGTGLLLMNGGALSNNVAGITLTNPISLQAAATVGVPAGTNFTLSGIITNSSATNMTKLGAGTLTLNPGSGNTNSIGSLAVDAGTLSLTSGTLNVTMSTSPTTGSTGPGLIISGSGSTLSIAGGTNNTLAGYACCINNGGTLTISSGTFSAGSELLNAYGSAGTINLNGGLMSLWQLRVSHSPNQGTVNLNGGTLQLAYINNSSSGGTVNLNGSTLQPTAGSTDFMGANSTYKVQAGGAIFNTAGFNITNNAPLIHDSALGATPDGGLTQLGTGTLTLTATNTYSGNTTINAGNLQGVVGGSCANSTVILNASTATNGVSVTDNTKSWTSAAFTAAAAGVLQFNFGVTPSTTVAPLVVTGAATFTATPTVSILGSIPAGDGTYPLMTWGSKSGTVPSAVTATVASGKSASLSNSPTTLYLVIAPISAVPFPVVPAATNLLGNGSFTQVTSAVLGAGSVANIFNINGSFGDDSSFWGSTANVTGWSPYHSDPYRLTTNVVPFVNNPSYVLNGTYYLDTLVDINQHSITLNSADYYLNGLIQTNILNGVTIKSGAQYQFVVNAGATAITEQYYAWFTAALTAGSGVNATNPATAVTNSLLSLSAHSLPTTGTTNLTRMVSGTDLIAAQTNGPVNIILNQINTNAIAVYPYSSLLPEDFGQVSQVKIYEVGLTVFSPTNDLNHDGVVDQNDVNLAQAYLSGSIDGGTSATNRENTLINTYGFTTNQALAYLNLTAFDVNGDGYFNAADVAALQALVGSATPPTLNYSAATPGQMQFSWSGSYKLQWLTNSAGLQAGGWVNYPNTNNPVTVTNHQTIPSAFFRLSQ